MKEFHVQQNEAGQRLDKLLAKLLNKAPKSFIYKMLRKKNITLNGKKADGSEKLAVQDEIKLFLSDETIEQFSEQVAPVEIETTKVEHSLNVIYEDKHIMVLNKPLGILSQKAERDDVSMVEIVISYLLKSKQITKEQLVSFKPAICNRLDRNTGGILIAGKSLLGLQEMAKLLKSRALNKYYLCIVKGKVEEKKRIEGYLSKDEEKNQVKIYKEQVENAEYICTEYEPLAYSSNALKDAAVAKEEAYLRNLKKSSQPDQIIPEAAEGNYTLLQVKLITGRSHQIRAHLASIGHPIIGDFKYGDQKTNHFFRKKYGLTHQLLHSQRMVFPMLEGELAYLSGKEFIAEVPELFAKIKKDLFSKKSKQL
jgi:23S rRNA pseudouridine955/2504/2580 synthase